MKLKNTKLTMNDIAQMAGVAKSTVSRYFNGGFVKAETKEKIRIICDQYNYKPNQAAKMLKAKHTNTIGIISPTLTSYTSSQAITSMDDYLKERGFRTIIINTNHSSQREKEAFEYLSELNVDGIIILATNNQYDYQELKKTYEIPILFMGQEIENGPSIVYDDYRSGYKAAAVADFTPIEVADNKIHKTGNGMNLELTKTTDILETIGKEKRDNQILIGFAMETEKLLESARKKLEKKNCDYIVANNLKEQGAGFAYDTNKVAIISKDDVKEYPLLSKRDAAREILNYCVRGK